MKFFREDFWEDSRAEILAMWIEPQCSETYIGLRSQICGSPASGRERGIHSSNDINDVVPIALKDEALINWKYVLM